MAIERELTLRIEVQERVAEVFSRIRTQARRFANEFRRVWDTANNALMRSFRTMGRLAQVTMRGMLVTARATARGIRAVFVGAFRQVGRAAQAMLSATGIGLAVGAVAGVNRAIGGSFQRQRTEAIFRATRPDARQRERLAAFAQQQAGGAFTEQQLLGAVVEGRRMTPANLERLIVALRGVAAAEGDIAMAVRAVQRAQFEGEAELAERYQLLLREQNLVKASQRIFGVKVTQLTAEQKAHVVLTEAIRQANEMRGLEAEMLNTTAGRWLLLKNRIDAALVSLGDRLQPAIEGVLNFLEQPLVRIRELVDNLGLSFGILFRELVANAEVAAVATAN